MNRFNSIERWKSAFAEAVRTAIEQDYFSDLLTFELGGNKCETKKEYDALWNELYSSFKEIFGEDYYAHFPYQGE